MIIDAELFKCLSACSRQRKNRRMRAMRLDMWRRVAASYQRMTGLNLWSAS